MRKILLIASLIFASSAALADTVVTSSTCRWMGNTHTCSVSTDEIKPAKPIYKSQGDLRLEAEEKAERIQKWEAFCKPAKVTDSFGVTRYVYAHENCDLGRSE